MPLRCLIRPQPAADRRRRRRSSNGSPLQELPFARHEADHQHRAPRSFRALASRSNAAVQTRRKCRPQVSQLELDQPTEPKCHIQCSMASLDIRHDQTRNTRAHARRRIRRGCALRRQCQSDVSAPGWLCRGGRRSGSGCRFVSFGRDRSASTVRSRGDGCYPVGHGLGEPTNPGRSQQRHTSDGSGCGGSCARAGLFFNPHLY